MTTAAFTLRARWIAPMSRPLIENGAIVVVDGRIADVSQIVSPRGDVIDLGDAVVLPGLINAHAHLELSHQSPGEPAGSFGLWLQRIVTQRNALSAEAYAEVVARATLAGAAESIACGVTTVGDISRECAVSRRALRDSPLNVVSFGEVQALAQRRVLLEERLATAIDDSLASDRLTIGVSPHAPYTVEPHAYRRCVEVSRERNLPICTHLAESLEETQFLNEHRGPLRELWGMLGTWDDEVPRWVGTPVELAKATGLLDCAPLLAHVNYASDNDLDLLAASEASVVWCPRTHAFFGHAPHRWREMLARGINVCVGTDSRASSPDLNVVDDLRLVHRHVPEVSAQELWEMVTTHAARALRKSDVGAIAQGNRADLVSFPARTNDPLRSILESNVRPTHTFVRGVLASGL